MAVQLIPRDVRVVGEGIRISVETRNDAFPNESCRFTLTFAVTKTVATIKSELQAATALYWQVKQAIVRAQGGVLSFEMPPLEEELPPPVTIGLSYGTDALYNPTKEAESGKGPAGGRKRAKAEE
jgi:hypothetical protein